MDNYYIEDNGKVRVLKFNKLKEFEDNIELIFTFILMEMDSNLKIILMLGKQNF